MSTTRSQKRRNSQQDSTESLSEGFVSTPIIMKYLCSLKSKSHRIENSLLESLRASLKDEITSDIKSLLVEYQKKMLKLLKPKTGENTRENIEEETEMKLGDFTPPRDLLESTQPKTTTRTRVVTETFAIIKILNFLVLFETTYLLQVLQNLRKKEN